MNSINPNDLWNALGSLEDDQAQQVLSQLFLRYEQRLQHHPGASEAESFMQTLAAIIAQVQSCNVSRR